MAAFARWPSSVRGRSAAERLQAANQEVVSDVALANSTHMWIALSGMTECDGWIARCRVWRPIRDSALGADRMTYGIDLHQRL